MTKDADYWTPQMAVELCRKIEQIAPQYDAHVALTGGCLYKDGPRKDADILFYRIRQSPTIDRAGLLKALRDIGIEITKEHGWMCKATFWGKTLDIFFPETPDSPRTPGQGRGQYD
jgi:hypothetical protein